MFFFIIQTFFGPFHVSNQKLVTQKGLYQSRCFVKITQMKRHPTSAMFEGWTFSKPQIRIILENYFRKGRKIIFQDNHNLGFEKVQPSNKAEVGCYFLGVVFT